MIVIQGNFKENTTRPATASFGTQTVPGVLYESLFKAYAALGFEVLYWTFIIVYTLLATAEVDSSNDSMWAHLGWPSLGNFAFLILAYMLGKFLLSWSAGRIGSALDEDVLKRACRDQIAPTMPPIPISYQQSPSGDPDPAVDLNLIGRLNPDVAATVTVAAPAPRVDSHV